jgi:iron complex outermembrane recepter protein
MKDLRMRKFLAVLPLFAAYSLLTTTGKAQAAAATTTTTTTTTTAATVAPTSDTDEPQVLEKYVVTGTNIPMAAEALAVPVLTVGQTTIQESGVAADTLDLLRKVAPNISGVGEENAQINTGSSFGGASVTVKGLNTLVLIDGRRVAFDPAESTGGGQFVDLNLIPVAAIDRFDILQDSASAIYGSDAVGGVINIILKKNYNGWEAGADYGFSTNTGHYAERSGYIVGGVATDKTSITVGFNYNEHDAMYLSQASYTDPIYGTYTFPGSIDVYNNLTGADDFYQLAPGVNAPAGGANMTISQLVANGTYVPKTATQQFETFNLANSETLIGYKKEYGAMVNMEHKIFGDNLVAFGNFIASHSFTWSSLNAQPVVPYIEDPWVDVNVFGYPSSPPPAGTTFVPVTAPGNPFSQTFLDGGQSQPESAPGFADGSGYDINVRNRFLTFPRVYQNDSTLFRVVGGLRGDITDDLHWEGAINIDRYTLNYTNPGLIDTNALNAALQDGQINPFAVNQAPNAFNGVVGTAFVNMLSTLQSYDFKIDGNLFDLPAGKLGFAVGVVYLVESLSAVPDVNSLPNSSGTTQGWSNATTFQQFDASRNVSSAFAEVNVPVTSPKMAIPGVYSLNLDGAVRYDDYSGQVGNTTNPEVSVGWQPFDDELKIRGSAGSSFVAPTLFSLYGPVSSGSTESITYNTVGGTSNTAQFNQTGGSNPALKPSTAKTWSAGFVYTPKQVKGLSISVDYSQINQKDIIGVVPANTIIQDVETNGTASPYVGLVHFNSPTGSEVSGPGGISSHSPQQVFVIANLSNLAGQDVHSTDIDIEYTLPTSVGKFTVSSLWTWYNSYTLELIPTEQFYQYTGYASSNEGTVPKWRTYTTFDYKKDGFDAVVGVTYVASVTDIGTGGDDQYGFEGVGSFTAFDASLTYDFKHLHLGWGLDGLKVTVGVNNAFNRLPPLAPNAFPDTNADVGTYDGAVGRMWYVSGKYSF